MANCFLRPIHTRDFSPGACSRGTLQEQSSSVCTNDIMGILHPREQNFHPAKCSTIFNQLNIWKQAPVANLASLKTLPRVYRPLLLFEKFWIKRYPNRPSLDYPLDLTKLTNHKIRERKWTENEENSKFG